VEKMGSGAKGERTANPTLAPDESAPTASLAPRSSSLAAVNSQLSTLDARLFSVRTPTAVVTDLGTEFGVEVEKSGLTRSQVFRGKVELRPFLSGGGPVPPATMILTAGHCACVKRSKTHGLAVVPELTQPHYFIRQIPRAGYRRSTDSRLSTPAFRPIYRFIDLGTLGGETSRAAAVSPAGQVVGESTTAAGVSHAFLYENGKMKDLGALGGNSSANAINSLGQIVGGSTTPEGGCLPFVYSNGVMKTLAVPGGRTGYACGINDTGNIVGVAESPTGIRKAFLYTNSGGMKDLGAFGGPDAESWAYEINAAGLVAGYAQTKDGTRRAFVYSTPAGMKDLGTLGGRASQARRINHAGQIVGFSAGPKDAWEHAFVYSRDTGMKDLGALSGPNSYAFDINNAGRVVGTADVADGSAHAFVSSDRGLIDLNSLVDPATGWILVTAMGINDSGEIAGFGTAADGSTRAFLLTPVKVLSGHQPATDTNH
jgi:probable HAF family extracellular repeat protein